MLDLKDFQYLPSLDAAIDRLVRDEPGLVVVAGLDPRPHATPEGQEGRLPSERATIFRILVRRLLPEGGRKRRGRPRESRGVVIAESKDAVRLPSSLRREVTYHLVNQSHPYELSIRAAVKLRPELLVVELFNQETAEAVLAAAEEGVRVLTQMDTVFRGVDMLQHCVDQGMAREALAALRWVVAVQRLNSLCPHCKEPATPEAADLAAIQQRYPYLARPDEEVTFYRGVGCKHCQGSGTLGTVAAFDVFRTNGDDSLSGVSVLALEQYIYDLAAAGEVALDDLLRLEAAQARQTYHLLVASEAALKEANQMLQRRLAQLEAANKVLKERTEALVSLQDVSHTLLSTADLDEQAYRVCVQCCALSGADRAVLYYLNTPATAQVLATYGWDAARVPARVSGALLGVDGGGYEARPFFGPPPGIPFGDADKEGVELRAGLQVPLVANGRPVGLMVVHSTRKASFAPGAVALVQTFANQAALAIQRAGLFEQLQNKIEALEAAQAGLAQKERMERELELARQVQQRMLPHTFPLIPGFRFATYNEPARHVGGDFYDVIRLDENHFGVAVADVSDKGMPAALYMALSRSLLLAEARRTFSPRAVLAAVNDLLLQVGEPDMFVTLFYGVVDCERRVLTYCRAGHDRPFLLRGGGVSELDGNGMALGLLPSDSIGLTESALVLQAGDRLVLYSDGLTDVLTAEGEMYDRERLQAVLVANGALSPNALCKAIFEVLRAFQGTAEQYDDMTLLVVGVDG